MTLSDSSATGSSVRFADLGVAPKIVNQLAREGKEFAFPIQAETLGDTLSGRDVLGRGKTGSGKTLAFSIPMAARLGENPSGRSAGRPRGLVLAPTRELATQIDAVLAPLAAVYGLRTTTIFGGVKQTRQVNALRSGVDIVVACPGRLEDLMKQGHVRLDAVEITILDEADHMADLGFLPGVTRIMDQTPKRGQRLLFSATLDNGVDKLVKRFMHNQVLHSVDSAESKVVAMTHHVFEVASPEAKTKVIHTLASGTGRRILFMRTKHQAKRLAKQLTEAGIPAVDLHGNLSQPQRDRNLASFSSGASRVLVATDVAARGVHVDDVELVIHVDPPAEHKSYLHRSGRTARAGSSGDVVTLVLPENRREVAQLLRKAGITAQPVRVDATSTQVAALVGEIAEYVAPVARVVTPDQGRARSSAGRGSAGRSSSGRTSSGRGSSGRGGSRTSNARTSYSRTSDTRTASSRPQGAGRAGAGHSGTGPSGTGHSAAGHSASSFSAGKGANTRSRRG